MIMTALLLVLAVVAAASLFATRYLSSGNDAECTDPGEVRSTSLEELSRIWTRDNGEEVIELAELARNWRSEVSLPEKAPAREKPRFRHGEIGEFHREAVDGRPFMVPCIRDCIEELLELLDDQGDCPSVVRRNRREAEGGLDDGVFALLAGVPLYRHSLNVAREMVSLCPQKVVVPKAVIAALAHDLGKLPSYQETMYSTGDHPYIASVVLEQVESFRELPYAGEIVEAVRQHHRPQPENELAQKLKAADQSSRAREIAAAVKAGRQAHGKGTGGGDQAEAAGGEPCSRTRECREEVSLDTNPGGRGAATAVFGDGEETDRDVFGADQGDADRVVNRKVPLDWFDAAATLSYIKQFVNRMRGGRFVAFSMPDGLVYVQVSFFWQAAKKLSGNSPQLLAADADIQARRNIMYSMVERLREENSAIATDLLGEGFYMAKFVINPDSGNSREASYIPFRAEAFGEPVSLLEAKKVARLREIRSVVPRRSLQKG